MTIYQLIQASQAHTDADWVLDDQEIGQVRNNTRMYNLLIALSRSPLSRILLQYRHRQRIVNICSMMVQVESKLATGPTLLWRTSQRRMALREPTFLSPLSPVVHSCSEGAYVRVLGSLKTFGNKKYINTNLIRPIDSPAEIYFHLLEAMTVTMVWERGPVSLVLAASAQF